MKKLYILLIAGSLMAGCNKFKSDINVDPNNPSKASGIQLIANSEMFLPSLAESPQAEFYGQYLAETQYPGGSLYPEGGTNFYGLYQGPLINLEKVLSADLTPADGPIANQRAVAKILKAYFMWNITDRWGDVPYSEALKGADNFTPKYDPQEAIYDSIFKLLTEANNMIVPGNISNEIVYGGDIAKWKRAANSIHLLAALRLSEKNPTKATAEFNAALAAGVFTANSDNLVYRHLADASNQSYWYDQVVNQHREWWALTQTLVDYMNPASDPRLPVYGKKTVSNTYQGLPFGTTSGLPNTSDYSLMGPAIYAQNAPTYLVTYAEILFAQAEAAKRGWITGGDATAKSFYDQAISQSVQQWTGSTTGLSGLMAAPGIAYDPANAMKQIGFQRWVHLFMHGYEAWSEWRRTGYPDNFVKPGGKDVPLRHAYPANEVFNNAANYQAAIQAQFAGQDDIHGRVWWDKP